MALSYIGKPISLVSHSDVRYRGILAGIDPAKSTIKLSNVISMGTEARRPPAQYIAPVNTPYEYIIFRASEVKDLAVDEPAQAPAFADPAVLNSQPMATGGYGTAPNAFVAPTAPGANGAPPTAPNAAYVQRQPVGPPAANAGPAPVRRASNANGVHTATASLETVERALGDLRVSQQQQQREGQGQGRRGREIRAGEIRVPASDFDFEGSNKRFDKSAGAAAQPTTGSAQVGDEEKETDVEKEEKEKSYDPKRSFFDTLSPGEDMNRAAAAASRGDGGRGRGRGGRNRREEERERNVATFGEPGGVGLMGPGAYVGGWGGFRRGGGRGRRGGHPAPAVSR